MNNTKTSHKLNEKGIAHHLMLLILTVTVLGVIGFAGWQVYQNNFGALAETPLKEELVTTDKIAKISNGRVIQNSSEYDIKLGTKSSTKFKLSGANIGKEYKTESFQTLKSKNYRYDTGDIVGYYKVNTSPAGTAASYTKGVIVNVSRVNGKHKVMLNIENQDIMDLCVGNGYYAYSFFPTKSDGNYSGAGRIRVHNLIDNQLVREIIGGENFIRNIGCGHNSVFFLSSESRSKYINGEVVGTGLVLEASFTGKDEITQVSRFVRTDAFDGADFCGNQYIDKNNLFTKIRLDPKTTKYSVSRFVKGEGEFDKVQQVASGEIDCLISPNGKELLLTEYTKDARNRNISKSRVLDTSNLEVIKSKVHADLMHWVDAWRATYSK